MDDKAIEFFDFSSRIDSFSYFQLSLSSQTPQALQSPVNQPKIVTLDSTVKVISGETVYVPIYSHIYTVERDRTWNLTATLSVRNTDLTYPIIIASVDYYDSNGSLLRKYLEQPIELKPLASTNFIVDQDDVSGGAGAAFIRLVGE